MRGRDGADATRPARHPRSPGARRAASSRGTRSRASSALLERPRLVLELLERRAGRIRVGVERHVQIVSSLTFWSDERLVDPVRGGIRQADTGRVRGRLDRVTQRTVVDRPRRRRPLDEVVEAERVDRPARRRRVARKHRAYVDDRRSQRQGTRAVLFEQERNAGPLRLGERLGSVAGSPLNVSAGRPHLVVPLPPQTAQLDPGKSCRRSTRADRPCPCPERRCAPARGFPGCVHTPARSPPGLPHRSHERPRVESSAPAGCRKRGTPSRPGRSR